MLSSQYVERNGGRKVFLKEALVSRGVVEREKPLMRLVKLTRGPGQGQLGVIQASLNIKMGLGRAVG